MFARIRQWWRNRKLDRQARNAPRYHRGGLTGSGDPRFRARHGDDTALYDPSNWSPLSDWQACPPTSFASDDRCPPPVETSPISAGHYDSGDSGGGSFSYDSGSSDSGGSCGGGGD